MSGLGPPGPPGPPMPPPVPPLGPPPPPRRSHKAEFWIGVALTLPVFLVYSVVQGLLATLYDQLPDQLAAVAYGANSLVTLGLVIAGLVWSKTRWFVLGGLAAVAVLLVVLAGLCIALLTSLS